MRRTTLARFDCERSSGCRRSSRARYGRLPQLNREPDRRSTAPPTRAAAGDDHGESRRHCRSFTNAVVNALALAWDELQQRPPTSTDCSIYYGAATSPRAPYGQKGPRKRPQPGGPPPARRRVSSGPAPQSRFVATSRFAALTVRRLLGLRALPQGDLAGLGSANSYVIGRFGSRDQLVRHHSLGARARRVDVIGR